MRSTNSVLYEVTADFNKKAPQFPCVISESFNFTREPADPTVVVEGVNSTQVHLVWNFTATAGFGIVIERAKSDGTEDIQIATLGVGSAVFVISNEVAAEYEAIPPGTLVIKEVTRNDEYVYSLSVFNSGFQRRLFGTVAVDVFCEYIKRLVFFYTWAL